MATPASCRARHVDELILAVTIVLDDRRPDDCTAADGDGDGTITIAELVRAVDAGLSGCVAPSPA